MSKLNTNIIIALSCVILLSTIMLFTPKANADNKTNYTVKEKIGRYYPNSHQILFKANTNAPNNTMIQIRFTDKDSNNVINKSIPANNGTLQFTLNHVKPGDYFIYSNHTQLGEMYIPN